MEGLQGIDQLIDVLSMFQAQKKQRRQQALARILGLAEDQVNANLPRGIPSTMNVRFRGPSDEPYAGLEYRREW